MSDFLSSLSNMPDWVSSIADIIGIISFIMSIVLLYKSEAIKKELQSQKTNYKAEQKNIQTSLKALRENIFEDSLFNKRIKSDLRTELYKYQQKYSRLLSLQDKFKIYKVIQILNPNPEKVDKETLCKHLDYLVARFDKKEHT